MKRTLTLLTFVISLSASAQEIETVLDTTKTTSPEFVYGLQRTTVTFNSPLYLLGKEEITQEQVSKIKPDQISSITVLKEASAIEKYGDKGKFGVIIIEMKDSKFKLPTVPIPDDEK